MNWSCSVLTSVNKVVNMNTVTKHTQFFILYSQLICAAVRVY